MGVSAGPAAAGVAAAHLPDSGVGQVLQQAGHAAVMLDVPSAAAGCAALLHDDGVGTAGDQTGEHLRQLADVLGAQEQA